MNKFITILLGLIFLLTPIYLWITNFYGLGTAAAIILKGGLMWFFIFLGALSLLIGLSSLKE
jgi:hypothetical protein